MRILEWKSLTTCPCPKEQRYRYGLLVEDIEVDGFHCESYGFLVADDRAGTESRCRHVTVNGDLALTLLGTLARCQVSPVHLADVVEDRLGQ